MVLSIVSTTLLFIIIFHYCGRVFRPYMVIFGPSSLRNCRAITLLGEAYVYIAVQEFSVCIFRRVLLKETNQHNAQTNVYFFLHFSAPSCFDLS